MSFIDENGFISEEEEVYHLLNILNEDAKRYKENKKQKDNIKLISWQEK